MKKLDKLILRAFVGPFFVTVSVVIFIFLMRLLIFYINQFVSKDVEFIDYLRLFYYCILNTIPIALPLAILLSSLMTFGNLGEFFELTAIKSAGISMTRVMRPVFLVVLGISIVSFVFNDRIAPKANLKFFSLLYNIKETKATMNIKEGIFYNELPGHSIKVDKKLADGKTMIGMVIYKHSTSSYERGNAQIILADSGRMYTINNNSYLVFELFNGNDYQEQLENPTTGYASPTEASLPRTRFTRTKFKDLKLVVSLESFMMSNTQEDMFKYHEYMKNITELNQSTDSLRKEYKQRKESLKPESEQYFTYNQKRQHYPLQEALKPGKWIDSLLNVAVKDSIKTVILSQSKSAASSMGSFATSNLSSLESKHSEANRYELEKYHKFTQSFSCLVLFLIGASLGAIIKKGGFGMPVLISIIFYILMYFFTIQGDKWVKSGLLDVPVGAWFSNCVLLIAGLYFLYAARNDSRLFDKDVYVIGLARLKKRLVAFIQNITHKTAPVKIEGVE